MTETPFHDPLVEATAENLPERFFDRFMFNMHPVDDLAPSIIVGYGVYPPRDVADGFAVVTTGTEQRNVRFSTELSAVGNDGAGPLRFACVTPNTTGEATSFDHLVQSGRYSGTLTLDGAEHSVDGWYGQRDRSRGVRTMAGGQGLHIWFQAQFADRSVGFLLVENRSGGPLLLEGAVMHEDGRLDDVTNVRHALEFTDGNDLIGGRVVVTTASGAAYDIACDATAGGGWMAGGGYGGHHGKPRGRDHIEHDVYPLDGSVSPRTLDSALTDRNTVFTWDGQDGRGIFEFALSRSSSYSYVPTLSES
jgi:hypothetical protein